VCCHYGVFKVHAGRRPPCREKNRATAFGGRATGLSKLNSVVDVEVDVVLGEPGHRTKSSRGRHQQARTRVASACQRAQRLPE
jgi:hypothetical protein